MKLKRAFAVMVIPLSAFAVAACGGTSSGGSADTSSNGSGDPVKVAVVLPSLNNPFWVAIKDGAEAEARRLGDEVELTVSAGADQSATDQLIAKIQDAQTRGPDAMALVANDTDALTPTVKNVTEAGTPVVALNADLPDAGLASFIGTDELEGGADAAAAMRRALPDGGKVGILHCLPGNPTSDARVRGFRDGIAGTRLTVVSVLDGRCDEARTPAVVNDMLTAQPDLAGLYSISDNMTVAAQRVLANAGKDDVQIVGYDAQPPVVQLIKQGKVYASVAQFPAKMGAEGVKAAVAAARGEPTEKRIDTGTLAVTRDNLAAFERQLEQR